MTAGVRMSVVKIIRALIIISLNQIMRMNYVNELPIHVRYKIRYLNYVNYFFIRDSRDFDMRIWV